MEQTKIYKALQGVRGRKPVDLQALESLLVRFSYVPVELPRIKEIDINPLLASPDGILALDARIVLFDRSIADAALPRTAIRPYPAQYVSPWKMKNGVEVLIRPIRPEDEPLMKRFHESLSEKSVFLRYFHMENLSSRVAHERLLRKCFIDYDREMALIAEAPEGAAGRREILAVGRLTRERDRRAGELAVLVTDRAQHLGLGTELIRRLIEVARIEGFGRIIASTLPENTAMRALAERFGFVAEPSEDLTQITTVLKL
jgi:acetyltransferase